uniref:Uncharacterized protein n=1 Tax=Photinus pyralis TaxID=7054 RepID=A0A1Y1NL17_PHOPY
MPPSPLQIDYNHIKRNKRAKQRRGSPRNSLRTLLPTDRLRFHNRLLRVQQSGEMAAGSGQADPVGLPPQIPHEALSGNKRHLLDVVVQDARRVEDDIPPAQLAEARPRENAHAAAGHEIHAESVDAFRRLREYGRRAKYQVLKAETEVSPSPPPSNWRRDHTVNLASFSDCVYIA